MTALYQSQSSMRRQLSWALGTARFHAMRSRPLLSLCLAVALAACGSAFKDAVNRGDQFAQAAMWDKAATEYQSALKLEPDNTDVQIKLRTAMQKQSGERLVRGKALMARGEIEGGLAVLQEAAKLDPQSTEAQRALDEANQAALRKAEELLATPEATHAFDLTQLVLAGSPNDPVRRAWTSAFATRWRNSPTTRARSSSSRASAGTR